MVVPCQKN